MIATASFVTSVHCSIRHFPINDQYHCDKDFRIMFITKSFPEPVPTTTASPTFGLAVAVLRNASGALSEILYTPVDKGAGMLAVGDGRAEDWRK